MGTNYYLHRSVCDHCGRGDEPQHIGKSSAGWCFALHVDEERRSLADWEREWADPSARIRDEYGESVAPEDMRKVITERSWPHGQTKDRTWYSDNHAEPGPDGLARHKIGRWCVGHGDGTYDLMPGEFS